MSIINRTLPICVLLLAGGMAITGCGGSADTEAQSSTSPNAQDKSVQFAQCMRQHGVNIPDPQPGGGGIKVPKDALADKAKLNAAIKACGKYGGQALKGLTGQGGTQSQDNQLKLARCLREHDIDVADTQAGQPLKLPPGSLNSARVKEALKTCGFGGNVGGGR